MYFFFSYYVQHQDDKKGKADTGYLVGLDNITRYFQAIFDSSKKEK